MNCIQRAYRRYILHRHSIPHSEWAAVIEPMAVFSGLSAVEKAHLRELASVFLYHKTIDGAGISITPPIALTIAALACLPVLKLGIGLLTGWRYILIYPDAFYVKRAQTDAYGVVHPQARILSGEAWQNGPVILSWADIHYDVSNPHSGQNVVIHEIAHKLDMLNGRANGMPPLHTRMIITEWTAAFSQAYQALQTSLNHHHHTAINPYAASDPAECFAVCSEYFFCAPAILHQYFPELYRQLQLYYRQDPLLRQN